MRSGMEILPGNCVITNLAENGKMCGNVYRSVTSREATRKSIASAFRQEILEYGIGFVCIALAFHGCKH